MSLLTQTPSQTAGPYFAYGLAARQYGFPHTSIAGATLAEAHTPGELIALEGRVLDGVGQPINDALVEIWQADATGRYHAPDFGGFGRFGTGTERDQAFRFQTIKPGSVEGQAPHINVLVFMRGLMSHLYTRLYFADEAGANALDPVLNSVPSDRRATLLAPRVAGPGLPCYRFDIRVQGEGETVFFDL
ncbi:protocatechuate 3,4-dioxygenase subunit alpha [Hymenobacter jejuensis]|uniref:Protocatechuate 3,4-dioxygenase subunit alpha n=1 Tax=Hymenobacter jejuensis TaxID=2502781 RepID=A0A5B8A4X7_9BACT|nr:protocatechuate 3,4-dioxygenase subunit alpha [Hymenobacter jejuensis]QDA62370.1 protocatechuate 3,4-dioxygenase subunit alpha [Hymenobacter jejuensis]